MDSYFNVAYLISACLFPLWWGLGIFAFKKLDNYMNECESEFHPVELFLGTAIGVLITLAVPLVPFILAFAIVGGGPAWLVYKGLDWASKNLVIKVGKNDSESDSGV